MATDYSSRLVVLVVGFHFLVACAEAPRDPSATSGGRGSPLPPSPTMEVTPSDLASGLDPVPVVQVLLKGVAPQLASDLYASTLVRARLTHVMSGSDVELAIGSLEPLGGSSVATSRMVIAPRSVLAPGWYELRVPRVGGVRVQPGSASSGMDGFWTTRIRIGEGPVVAAIAACPAPPDGSKPGSLILRMSEPTRLPPGAGVPDVVRVVAADGSVVDCDDAALSYPGTVMLSPSRGDLVRTWELYCSSLPSQLSVAVDGSVQSAHGQGLETLGGDPGSLAAMQLAKLPFENDCFVWRP